MPNPFTPPVILDPADLLEAVRQSLRTTHQFTKDGLTEELHPKDALHFINHELADTLALIKRSTGDN